MSATRNSKRIGIRRIDHIKAFSVRQRRRKKRNLLKAPDNFRPPSQKQKKFDPLQKKKDFTELSEEKKAKRVYFITVKVGRQKL